MGYELRRQLREVLGPSIAGLQRAVALEIADDANDRTRLSAVPLDDLVRWTGAKDAGVVRNALKRLAAAGWEFRVPIGKGKDGRLLYAVPGRRMTYRVPDFEGVATATPKEEPGLPHGGAGATPQEAQGGATAHSEGATATPQTPKGVAGAHSEGAGATPSPSTPTSKPASQPDTYGIPDAARPLVDALTNAGVVVRWPFKGDGWWPVLAIIQKSGIPAMVDHAVKAARRTDIQSASYFLKGWRELAPLPKQRAPQARPALPPHCGHIDCDPVSRQREREDDNGLRSNYPCPDCHPNARKEQAA